MTKEGTFVLRAPAPRCDRSHIRTSPSHYGASEYEPLPSKFAGSPGRDLLHHPHFTFSLPSASVMPVFFRSVCRLIFLHIF